MSRLYMIYKGQCEIIDIGLELTIGRSYANRLRLEGPDISRAHAIIYRRGDEFVLRDLDSKNGIVVNNQRLTKHTLKPTDTVTIGEYTLIFDPPESFDLSQWLPQEPATSKELGETDTQVQRRHQRFPPGLIEKSFSDSQELGGVTIARAGAPLRFSHQLITRLEGREEWDAICKGALDWAVEMFAAHRGLIALCDKEGAAPRAVAMFDTKEQSEIKIHQRVVDWLFENGEALISVESNEDSKPKDLEGLEHANRIAMPLTVHGRVRGFIYLENDPPATPFTIDDLQRLYCMALVTSRGLEATQG